MAINHNLVCSQCQVPFVRQTRLDIRTKNRFCSSECKFLFITKKFIASCKTCAKSITRTPGDTKNSKNLFCSHSCSAKYSNNHKATGTRRSKLENKIEVVLRTKFPFLDIVCNQTSTIGSELDFYFPGLNLALEINGIFHHKPIYGQERFAKVQNSDKNKEVQCQKLNIKLHSIDVYTNKPTDDEIINHCISLLENAMNTASNKNINFMSIDPLRGAIVKFKLPNPKHSKAQIRMKKFIELAIFFKDTLEKESITVTQLVENQKSSRSYICRILGLNFLPTNIINDILNYQSPNITLKNLVKISRKNRKLLKPHPFGGKKG